MRLLAGLRRYMAAEDPRIADTNLIAMVLAWNTPFYPLYVLASAGAAMQPGAWLTLPVFLVFLAVPAVTRRYPLAGRVLLVAAGIANTLYCTWLLGEAAGTWLFLLPCAALAPLLFRRTERGPLVIFLALPVAAGLALTGSYSISPRFDRLAHAQVITRFSIHAPALEAMPVTKAPQAISINVSCQPHIFRTAWFVRSYVP